MPAAFIGRCNHTLRHVSLNPQELLRKGMVALSQAEVGSALQVYCNLGELKEVLHFYCLDELSCFGMPGLP